MRRYLQHIYSTNTYIQICLVPLVYAKLLCLMRRLGQRGQIGFFWGSLCEALGMEIHNREKEITSRHWLQGQDDTEDYLSCFRLQSWGEKWRIPRARHPAPTIIITFPAKISHNQSLGYKKFQRSLNAEPLPPAILFPKLGKDRRVCRTSRTEEVLQQVSHSSEPYSFLWKYRCDNKGMRVI